MTKKTKCKIDALATHIVRNTVPDAVRPGGSVFQSLRPAGLVEVAPSKALPPARRLRACNRKESYNEHPDHRHRQDRVPNSMASIAAATSS
jgi:hypothetical protein